jgi:hypothetical protein
VDGRDCGDGVRLGRRDPATCPTCCTPNRFDSASCRWVYLPETYKGLPSVSFCSIAIPRHEQPPPRWPISCPTLTDLNEFPAGPMTDGSDAMHGFRPVAEPEVVLAFLRREVDSDRFGHDVKRALVDADGLGLVRSPDLDSEEENWARQRGPRLPRQGGLVPRRTAARRPRAGALWTTPTGTSSRRLSPTSRRRSDPPSEQIA